MLQNKYDTEN